MTVTIEQALLRYSTDGHLIEVEQSGHRWKARVTLHAESDEHADGAVQSLVPVLEELAETLRQFTAPTRDVMRRTSLNEYRGRAAEDGEIPQVEDTRNKR
jgi:hypothetical protein